MVLGQEKGPNGELHLVSLRDNPRAIPCDAKGGVIVLHPVASLFFGNAECLRDDVRGGACVSIGSMEAVPDGSSINCFRLPTRVHSHAKHTD